MAYDLSLPHRASELGQYNDYNWDDAAFAVYTLLGAEVPLEVASALEKQWLEQGNENHLVRPVSSTLKLNILRDVVEAHIAMDKSVRERSDGGAKGDLEWWPTAFVVAVREDWRTKPGGLLFVFADEENGYELNKFFFSIEDAFMMLSSFSFGDMDLAANKAAYGLEPE
jgi:hypothetical protein